MIELTISNGEKCPVTGLSITVKDGWSDINLIEGYSVSFAIIGEHILYVTPKGNSGKNGMELLTKHRGS